MTAAELNQAFGLYFSEMQRCEDQRCYWALLHLLLVMPDVCGALENRSNENTSDRYVRWCDENMPSHPKVLPGDRYQMRNAVLHQGTTVSDNSKTKLKAKQTLYRYFSFVDPVNFNAPIHQTVSENGEILNIDISELARDTRQALATWFGRLEQNPMEMAEVARNLRQLARVRPKQAQTITRDAAGNVFFVEHRGITTSST